MLTHHGPDSIVAWGNGKNTSAADMLAHVEGFASLLAPAESGQEIVVMCRDRYRFAVAMIAAWQRGYSIALPPNPQLETIRAIRERPGVVTAIHDIDGVDKGIDVRAAHVQSAARERVGLMPHARWPALPQDRLLATVYTSGSTGEHTACPKTAGQLLGEARVLARTFEPPVGSRFVPMVPTHHIYGLLFGVLLPLSSGGAFYRHTPLHASEIAALASAGIDVLVTVPAHLRGMLIAKEGELPRIARVFSSAAPLSPRVASQVRARFGWTISEVFGSSETGGIGWRDSGGQGPWTPLSGVSVAAGDDERIRVDSPFLGEGPRPYVGADRVRVHPDGTFEHLGRADDVHKVGGVRVAVPEVEQRLLAIDGVRDAAVIAREVGGARHKELWAAVVAPGLDVAHLRAELTKWLAPVAVPRRFKLVDALPRAEHGKLRRADVEALFGASRHADEESE
ncbi:MAG: class I adenylate-forming enzyme family protein [Sandaracinaceae bacterium]